MEWSPFNLESERCFHMARRLLWLYYHSNSRLETVGCDGAIFIFDREGHGEHHVLRWSSCKAAGPARVRSTLPFFLFERRVVWYRRRFNGALNANSVCLCLTNVNLGDEGVAALVAALGEIPSVRSLVLSLNNITDVGAHHLARAIEADGLLNLERLGVASNPITDDGLGALLGG